MFASLHASFTSFTARAVHTGLRLGLTLGLVTAIGCTTDEPAGPGAPQLPTATRVYAGRYLVPTVTPELEAAAVFPVAEIDWTVVGGVATLHYDLPVGLVGGVLDVTLTGPIDPDGTTATLTGEVGVGTCTAGTTGFACLETFTGLGTLPISMAVVEDTARVEYPSGVADRRAVASQFASDPIGIAEVDYGAPVVDDSGGGGT